MDRKNKIENIKNIDPKEELLFDLEYDGDEISEVLLSVIIEFDFEFQRGCFQRSC